MGQGFLDEDYCKWCYADGVHTYTNMSDLINNSIPHMVKQGFTEEQAREYMENMLPTLDYWKKYQELGDDGEYEIFKRQLIDEFNALEIEGLPPVENLNPLVGSYINLEYPLPNGQTIKFLDDEKTYLECDCYDKWDKYYWLE